VAFRVPLAIPVNALLRLDPLAMLVPPAWLSSGTAPEALDAAMLLVALTMEPG
jgi:hypothetical protein